MVHRNFKSACISKLLFATLICFSLAILTSATTAQEGRMVEGRMVEGRMVEGRMGPVPELDGYSLDFGMIDDELIDMQIVSDFWIGIQCEKADDTTIELDSVPGIPLAVKGGMLVNAVTEGQAAKTGGMRENDVLLTFGGLLISNVNELHVAIGEAGENPVEVVVIRDGKPVAMTVTPQRRPEKKVTEQEEFSIVMTELDKIVQSQLENGDLKIPEGFEIVLRAKSGSEAELIVENGDTKWTVTESNLANLPSEVYPAAVAWYRMASDPELLKLRRMNPQQVAQQYIVQRYLENAGIGESKVKPSLDDKLDALKKQIDQLSEAVAQLKDQIGD